MYNRLKVYEWVNELFSGDYKQTTGELYDPRSNGFCCLGVAGFCGIAEVEDDDLDSEYAPATIAKFAGFDRYDLDAFAQMNDESLLSFEEIGYIALLALESGEKIECIYDERDDVGRYSFRSF